MFKFSTESPNCSKYLESYNAMQLTCFYFYNVNFTQEQIFSCIVSFCFYCPVSFEEAVVVADELKVAFSAGLTDSGPVGPFDEETTLIFSKTITNVGGAYNQSAGTSHTCSRHLL